MGESNFKLERNILALILRARINNKFQNVSQHIDFDFRLFNSLMDLLSESSKISVREFIIDSETDIENQAKLVIFDPELLEYVNDVDEVYDFALNVLQHRIDSCTKIIDEVKDNQTSVLVLNKQLELFQMKQQLCALKEVRTIGHTEISTVKSGYLDIRGCNFKLDWRILSLIIRNIDSNKKNAEYKYIDFDFRILLSLMNELSDGDKDNVRELIMNHMSDDEKIRFVTFDPECLEYVNDLDMFYQKAAEHLKRRIERCDKMIAEISTDKLSALVLNKQRQQFQLKKQLLALEEKRGQMVEHTEIDGTVDEQNRYR